MSEYNFNYNELGNFIDFIHKNRIPNTNTTTTLLIENYIVYLYIDIYFVDILTDLPPFARFHIIANAVNKSSNIQHTKVCKSDDKNYSKIIDVLKLCYTNQNIPVDYKLIGDFMIELNKVLNIEISDISIFSNQLKID